ncbi:MAG: hypothetical protein JEY91_13485, partial [Spirochaetaceae bacterium]|nr:hypothetical protein [Spirochaetaceae bacterium]
RYLFSEKRKIKNFAIETEIIRLYRFSTKINLNPLIMKVFAKNISIVTKELIKSLKPILEKGWYYLEKRDYNLIVLLYKLCREISQIDFTKFNHKSTNLIDKIPAVELLFLILNYEPSDVKELLYAVDTVFGKDPSMKEIQQKTVVNIHKLLDKDQLRPSLYNLIIAFNIIKTKKYLELVDLQNPSLQLIDIHDYNCTPKVRDKIDDYLRELEKEILPFLEQEKEVYRLQAFLPTDGQGVIDYSLIEHFYNTTLHSQKLSYKKNKENIIKFIINLGNAFLHSFRDSLSETITLENKDEIRLFEQNIFGQDILRIEFNLGKLDKIQTILPKFPTSRFLSIKKTMSGAIKSEAEAIQVIDEITSTIVTMGKRLAHILRNSPSLSYDDDNNNEISFFSFDETSYMIPHQKRKISSSGYLNGCQVKEALFKIAGVCYQTGALIQHNELSGLLSKEKQIRDEIRIKNKQYKRIAHEKVYSAFLEKYDIPL